MQFEAAEEKNVNGATTQQVLAAELAQNARTWERIYCGRCGSDRVYRIQRVGFLREKIFPLFGVYPWECRLCRKDVLLRKRNKLRIFRTRPN